MKQSTTQPPKVEVNFPDYLTVNQFQSVMELEKADTIWYKMTIISITLNMDVADVKKLPMEILPKVYNDCVEMFMKQSQPIQAIKIKGKTLILSVAFLKTVGEFCDLEVSLKSENVKGIAGVMFQEYEGELEGEWESLGDLEVIYVNEDITKLKSDKLKPYDSNNALEEDFFSDFPISLYQSTLSFIVGIGASYSLTSNHYSLSKLQLKELLKQSKLIMDGLVTSLILRKLISYDLSKVAA